ncbi:hypothetical protein PtA15_18A405 [Puccinia triticina]|uniref:Uncharacterized protein n=1 Tax=Puccinia triticina TaxID=208348 RepID=A0ABY7D8U9_9BASI|nr:uncharacterized protein PtA15_18A405 [Puccinia triticina]WAQ93345.1 hypothetical protein PtA15_18A405 [Puccinia triticina]
MDEGEVFKIEDLKRGSDYLNTDSLNSQAIGFLHSQHMRATRKVVDFDLHAVFLMQEFGRSDSIQKIVRMIRKTYDEDFPPKTTLQSQLVGAAKLVEHWMQVYHKNRQANPTVKKPFCLQYPTYIDVIKHSISSEDKCAADKTIKCSTHDIKKEELQGHGDHWKSEPEPNLPEPLRTETSPRARELVELRHDMVFYHRLSYWINKAFLPEASLIAEQAVDYLEKSASSSVKEVNGLEDNVIIAEYDSAKVTGLLKAQVTANSKRGAKKVKIAK